MTFRGVVHNGLIVPLDSAPPEGSVVSWTLSSVVKPAAKVRAVSPAGLVKGKAPAKVARTGNTKRQQAALKIDRKAMALRLGLSVKDPLIQAFGAWKDRTDLGKSTDEIRAELRKRSLRGRIG